MLEVCYVPGLAGELKVLRIKQNVWVPDVRGRFCLVQVNKTFCDGS